MIDFYSRNIAEMKLASLKEELLKSDIALCTKFIYIEPKILKELILLTNNDIAIIHKGTVKKFIFMYKKVKDLGLFKVRLERKH